MFPGIPHSNHTLPEISLEQFEEINESELNCIFAETGADREVYFNYKDEVEKLYYNGNYSQLIRDRKAYQDENDFRFFNECKEVNNDKQTKQDMIAFETDEMQSMGHTQAEIDEHIKWKFNS